MLMIFGIKKKYNFDPYNVLLAIATNILQRLKTGFVLQARVTNVKWSFEIQKSKDTLNVKLEPPVGVSKSLISESLRLNRII